MAENNPPVTKRKDGFIELYANNARFEQTVYDLKITFGQTAQQTGEEVIEQSASVTIPWGTAKLLHYYLGANIALHEMEMQPIMLHGNQAPPELEDLPPSLLMREDIVKAYEELRKTRLRFIASSILPRKP